MSKVVCTMCGHEGRVLRQPKGSFLVELILWGFSLAMLIFFFPLAITGLIYSLWRITGKRRVCRKCRNESVVPVNSPRAGARRRVFEVATGKQKGQRMKRGISRAAVCALTLAAAGCGAGSLTSEAAQEILNGEIGTDDVFKVVGIRAISDTEIVARVTAAESSERELNVTFERFDTGWRPGDVELGDRSVPFAQLIDSIRAGLQRRTMVDMREIGTATAVMRIDTGAYAEELTDLADVALEDAWGNEFVYAREGDGYRLTSFGSDGQVGPAPPSQWPGKPFEPDIVLKDGEFIQAPTGR